MDSHDGVSQAAGPGLNVPHQEGIPKYLLEEVPAGMAPAMFWELEASQTQLNPSTLKQPRLSSIPACCPQNQP